MTPSEVADWLESGGDWATAARDHEGAEKHYQAAATIRELEARLDEAVEIFKQIEEHHGIECIPDNEIQAGIRALLSKENL